MSYHNPFSLSAQSSSSNLNSWLSNVTLTTDHVNIHSDIKKYEVFETPVDALALSCTLQRLRKENPGVKFRLMDTEVVSKVKYEDEEKGRTIKDYYSKKIMMGRLNDQYAMTNYRTDLNKLIHGSTTLIKSTDIGLICFLPTFYEQDVALDNVKSQVTINQNFTKMNQAGTPYTKNISVALTPISKISRRTKRTEITQYWFKDSDFDAGIMIELKKDNPLIHIWDYMFENESTIKVKGSYTRRILDNFEHYTVTSWELDRG